MLRSLLLALSGLEAPRKFLTSHSLGRRLARRFVAGECLEDALQVVRQLNGEGFEVTLDYLGEGVHETKAAEEAGRVYCQILDRLAQQKLRSTISVKLTHLGLTIDPTLARRLVQGICEKAVQHGNFVRIDMEGSAYTEMTLRLFGEVNSPREVLGVVIQAYLYRSEKDVDDLSKCGAHIRLVKGAYNEPPGIAFPRKTDVDQNYRKLMGKLLLSGGYHAIATHDDRMVMAAMHLAREHNVRKDRFEFQMLYGIRKSLQRKLQRQGYRVRIYVPYGGEWYPYFVRRLAERPANLLFLVRSLLQG